MLQVAAAQAGMSEGECALLVEPWNAGSASKGLGIKVGFCLEGNTTCIDATMANLSGKV